MGVAACEQIASARRMRMGLTQAFSVQVPTSARKKRIVHLRICRECLRTVVSVRSASIQLMILLQTSEGIREPGLCPWLNLGGDTPPAGSGKPGGPVFSMIRWEAKRTGESNPRTEGSNAHTERHYRPPERNSTHTEATGPCTERVTLRPARNRRPPEGMCLEGGVPTTPGSAGRL